MALKAGRKGVRHTQVDKAGTIKVSIKPEDLPLATANKKGAVMPVTYDDGTMPNKVGVSPVGRLMAESRVPDWNETTDKGKVLSVGDNGDLEWQEAGAGGGCYVGGWTNVTGYEIGYKSTTSAYYLKSSAGSHVYKFDLGKEMSGKFLVTFEYTSASDYNGELRFIGGNFEEGSTKDFPFGTSQTLPRRGSYYLRYCSKVLTVTNIRYLYISAGANENYGSFYLFKWEE